MSTANGPAQPADDFYSILSDFREFWDSGSPRLGENGAQGWKSSSKPYMVETKPPTTPPSPLSDSTSDIYLKWVNAEVQAEHEPRPLRSHETFPDDIDPYQVVFFSDIQSLLFPIQSSESLQHLALAFLSLLGINILPPRTSTTDSKANDPHMVPVDKFPSFWPSRASPRDRPWQVIAGEPMEPDRQSNMQRLTDSPVKCWSTTRDTLITGDWFSDFDAQSADYKDVSMIRYAANLLRRS
jgi:hypothetical protein